MRLPHGSRKSRKPPPIVVTPASVREVVPVAETAS
jgi:hypothetical protein